MSIATTWTMLSSVGLRPETFSHKENSVVVVGSGPAGAAAALALIERGVDVTLLEAGQARGALGLTVRVAGVTMARIHRQLSPRLDGVLMTGDSGAVLYEDVAPGGLTNHWSCAVPRFSRDDFDDARRAGEVFTWPVAYDDLAPWYDWVEPRLCISGSAIDVPQLPAGKVANVRALTPSWAPIAAEAQRDGQAVVPVPYVYGGRTTLTFSGTVFNSFVRLIKPALQSRHLNIRFESQAIQLEWSGATRRVAAVIVRDSRTGSTTRIPCRAVVIAAGAINSTKLLLQSTNADFPEGLGNTHGVLGRYLHDHPLGKLMIELGAPLSFLPAAYVTRRPLDRSVPLCAAACLQWSGVYRLFRSVLKGRPGELTSCGFSVFGTMTPSENNFVALDSARTCADGTPGLRLNIAYPPEAAETLTAARDQLINLLDKARLRPRTELWLIDAVGSAIHYAGTCRMHASPRFGMLDAWSRLHSVPNVVVADSSAFTTGPEKNPVLTAMALAARASHRLAEDLRTGVI
jgi:choline dehydrogenase-like flavoprotein